MLLTRLMYAVTSRRFELPPHPAATSAIAIATSSETKRHDLYFLIRTTCEMLLSACLKTSLTRPLPGREPAGPRAAAERETRLLEGRAHGERLERPGRHGHLLYPEHGRAAGDAVVCRSRFRSAPTPRCHRFWVRGQDRVEAEVHQVERREEVTSVRRLRRRSGRAAATSRASSPASSPRGWSHR